MINLELERVILAQCIGSPNQAMVTATQSLTPEMFYDNENRAIFQAMQMAKGDEKAGHVTDLLFYLKKHPHITVDKLLKITDALTTTADVESDIRTLCDNHNSRRLLNFLQEKIVDIQLSGQPYSAASEILDRLKDFLPNSTKTDSNKDRLFALSAKLYDGMNGKVTKLMSTGIRKLDNVLGGGFENGTLTIIAGRPGMGKTALITSILWHQVKNKIPSGMVSMEMTDEQMARREAAMLTDIPYNKLKDATRITEPEYQKVVKAAWDNLQLIELASCGVVDLPQLRRHVFDLATRKGCKIIAIDYLQRMDIPVEKGKNEASAIGQVANAVKSMAKTLNIPIILLSQLGRDVEKRQDKKPNMSDLRGSGMIEEAADVIILMYREAYYNTECQNQNTCDLIVEKNRDGDAGLYVTVGCEIGINKFYDIDHDNKYPSKESCPF